MATTGAESQSDSNAHGVIEIPADEHSVGTFPPFDGSTYASQILWLAITFGLLYWIMSKVALPRISGILEDRRDRIAGDLAEANRLNEESNAAIAAYEQALAEARDKAHGIAQETRDKLKADIDRRREETESQLTEKLSAAEKRISEIKGEALASVGEIASETTAALVESLVGKAPTKTDLKKAVDAAMK
ncbi:MAG: ATP F0F1 synthase subunit B' [Stappia sp.]|uniref:F0F1 ATP synthase subunit B n=1 Tax=Stappia sp. TaxID=1870903 RepID=UPI000C60B7B6|nr:F0F1 ATP synthase subunit B [Stappia sp.]MAA96912.1 ATP F0F1 synthase subunit B' [Stappia sp.]MBM19588.1 ATP F0F1 synthase subunit B' [Stappia sp.]MBM21220.1 ATP F0F1 synthase subunit B' [Stappia sp.]